MKGKLILVEGTDCSGKETQTKKIIERLSSDNINCIRYCFPNYESPTGKIIGGPYLGKEYICSGWFDEGASNVDPKVSSLYYGADFLYNIGKINEELNKGNNVILDRYFYSSFAHQGGKMLDKDERLKMYKWLEKLEFELLELPDADLKIFLHMPYDVAEELRRNRKEKLDQNESSKEHLINAENAYIEVADLYKFKTIECSCDNKARSIDDINDELYNYIISNLK